MRQDENHAIKKEGRGDRELLKEKCTIKLTLGFGVQ